MSIMTEEQKLAHRKNPNVMPKIQGKTFRCTCKCNVFHHPEDYPKKGVMDDDYFECNACHTIYKAERY